MVSVDLRQRLQDEKCAERADVCEHFMKLQTMREDLASMGHPPATKDFYVIILGSLPPSFDPYISTVNATSSIIGTSLSSNNLMQTVTEEYEHRVMKLKGMQKEENVAYTADSSRRGQGGSGGLKRDVECYNCHKKGHYQADCWAPGGGKKGEGPKGKGKTKGKGNDNEKDTAAATSTPVSVTHAEDYAWMAMADTNVSDFMEDPNVAGLVIDDKNVVTKDSSIGASSYLTIDEFCTIPAASVAPLYIPPITTFRIRDQLETYASDDNWMLEGEFHDLPGLEEGSDMSDEDDSDSEDRDTSDDEDSKFESGTDDSDKDMPPLETMANESDDEGSKNEPEVVGGKVESAEESRDNTVGVTSGAESDEKGNKSSQPPHS